MKYTAYFAVIITALCISFFAFTYRYPYLIGWQGELSVGYYRFKIITYNMIDYGHKNNVEVHEILYNPINSFYFLLNPTALKLTR